MSDTDEILELLTGSYNGPAETEPDRTPSRSDNFYHGTVEHLAPGDVIKPVLDMDPEQKAAVQARGRGQNNTSAAWATVDPEEARTYGENVYQVEPLGEASYQRTGHVASRQGLKVVRKHDG